MACGQRLPLLWFQQDAYPAAAGGVTSHTRATCTRSTRRREREL